RHDAQLAGFDGQQRGRREHVGRQQPAFPAVPQDDREPPVCKQAGIGDPGAAQPLLELVAEPADE
ncbi:MAG: hypothetical protein WCD38_14205, partial [Candidatus Tumulicola sp.]